jgi:hypothetical protein
MNRNDKYPLLKSTIEELFGDDAWRALKDSNRVLTWRKYAEKILKAVELSVADSVEVCDPELLKEISDCLQRGLKHLKLEKDIDDIVGVIAGTMTEMSFLQLGSMPRRKGTSGPYRLQKGKWQRNGHRSVVYVQTKAQKENSFLARQELEIGSDAQLKLKVEYRGSKSELQYPEWCAQRSHKKNAVD